MRFLKRPLSRQVPEDPLANLPLMPGGCLALQDDRLPSAGPALAALLGASQRFASRHPNGDAVFLMGLAPEVQVQRFPEARPITPEPVLDGLVLSPGTYALILRMLYGEGALAKHSHDLLLLEMLGMQAPKPIPLPLFPEWVEQQLTPESLVRALTHPMSDEKAAGAALKALMMHPDFKFAILDGLPGVAERVEIGSKAANGAFSKSLGARARRALDDWQQHAQTVCAMAQRIVEEPPQELFFLAEMRRCIEAGGSWVLADDMAARVAQSLHVMGMANGLRERHHWYVDLSAECMRGDRLQIQQSLERFAFQLWQQSEARENGFGPSLWCYYDAPASGHAPRRMLHGTQATLASLSTLSPLLQEDRMKRGIEEGAEADVGGVGVMDRQALGLFEASSGKFRLLRDTEARALDATLKSHSSCAPLTTGKRGSTSQ